EAASRLNPNDTQRVVRAYEVAKGTGKPLSEWQKVKGTPLIDMARALAVVIEPDRAWLTRRIEARFDAMMAAGALEEVRAFAALSPQPEWPALRALGVRPLMDHLAGEVSLEEAVARAKAETRAYAKRQMTWFRHQMPGWHVVPVPACDPAVAILSLFSQVREGA
ncbi:MAG TPA: tRNA dimethylallyltransferase, partial [Micropepsaceae bacterium]|nr:tRNA dimethylallyltransferase [Micropepsaceae bacterium]